MGVVTGIERFEGRSSFKTWLFRILVNRARSAGSREQRTAPIEPLHAVDPIRFDAQGQWADPVDRWTDESEDRLDAATWSPILQSALDDLPPRQRQVVVLRDVEGLSHDEACAVLGISAGNQRILLAPGQRLALREILEAEIGEGLTDAVTATQGHRVPAGGRARHRLPRGALSRRTDAGSNAIFGPVPTAPPTSSRSG